MGAHRSPATVFRKISISIPRGREPNGDRESERETEKRRNFRRPLLAGPRSDAPCPPHLPSSPYPSPSSPRALPARRPQTCLFLQFARRPTIRFPGVVRLPYKCKAREIRPRSAGPNGPQIRSRGNSRGDHLHLPRIIPLSLISFLPHRPNESG